MFAEQLDIDFATLADLRSAGEVEARSRQVLRPIGALRRLDEVAIWLAGWQRTGRPHVDNPRALIFAGDHGVVADGVSAYPASVTPAMVEALRSGVATAAVMARRLDVEFEVIDVGVGRPTGNIRHEPALSHDEFHRAIEIGRDAVSRSGDIDLLVIGELGIGNTTPASAIGLALFGGDAADWVGPGAGLGPDAVAHKTAVVAQAVARVSATDPLEIARQLGGWELAAMAGAIAEARRVSIPVLLDGFVVTAAVMPLEKRQPRFLDHCWPAHVSAEPGHARLVAMLGRRPLLDLEMRLGEASGALAALPLIALAASAVVDVATFGEWGIA